MLKSFDPSTNIQFGWDSTSIKLAEECLRKYQLKMLEGWQPETLSVHLRFGQHYATALEHYYKRRAAGEDYDTAVLGVVEEALVDTWDHELDAEGNRIAGTGTPWHSEHNTKTRENLIRTIVWYLDQFQEDVATTLILSDGTPAVEYSFALPVDNGIIFSGHIDRVVEYAGAPYV